MRLTSTLFVTEHRARVSTSRSTLTVTLPDGDRTRIPMESLDALVLLGQAQVTSQAMTACVQRGIHVTSLTRSGRVKFQVRGGVAGNVELRRAQLSATFDEHHKHRLAMLCVAGKLQNARRAIERWRRDAPGADRPMLERRADHVRERLSALTTSRDVDHVRGLEGEAARQYFRAMSCVLARRGYGFPSRRRRPPTDIANSLLGFVYALMTAEVVGALTAVGLDPQIGYLHEQRPGRPALALDVLEELRTGSADRFVVRALMRGELGPDDFEARPGGAVHLTDDGRRRALILYRVFCDEEVVHPVLDRAIDRWALPHAQSMLLARHLRGDLPDYPPFVGVT